jgi:predicted nucleic acid-binding protein
MTPWPVRVFCDTSFFFACLEPRDENHAPALTWLKNSQTHKTVFLTTWDVLSETITLLRRKSGYPVTLDFIDEIVPSLRLIPTDESIRQEALAVFRRFAKDKKLSFCDCVSFVILTTQYPETSTATFDIHFKSLGLPVLPIMA